MENYGFVKFNGTQLPNPKYLTKIEREQLVDSARNAKGVVIGSKINRRLVKLNLTWPHLTASEWSNILKMIEDFTGEVEFYDPLYKKKVKYKMYWGNSSEEIFRVDPDTYEVLEYINCTCNLVDTGDTIK